MAAENENPRRSTRMRRWTEKGNLFKGEDDSARQELEPVQVTSTSTAVSGGDSEATIDENQCPKCLFKFTRPENLTRHLTQRKKWCRQRVEENRKKEEDETQEQEGTQQEDTEMTMGTEKPRRSSRTRRMSEKLILSKDENANGREEPLEVPSSSISIAAASGGDPRRNLNEKEATIEKNQCPKCLYKFTKAKSLLRHQRIALERCQRRMEENRKMKGGTPEVKITSKRADGSYGNALTCRECSQAFGTRQMLRIHLKKEHKRKLFHCKRCTWWSTRLKRLEEHCVKAHGITLKPGGDEGFKCRCNICYESEEGLSKHLEQTGHKRKMGEVTKCCQCSRMFEDRNEHKVHMEVIHGRQCFQCQKCDKWYLRKDNLKEHQRKVHAGKEEGMRKKKEVTTRLGRRIKSRRESSPSEMEVDQEEEWEEDEDDGMLFGLEGNLEWETDVEEEIGGDDGASGGDDDEEWLDDPKDFAEMKLLEAIPEEGLVKLEKLQGMASRNRVEQKKKWDPNWFLHMGRFKKEDSIWEQGKE